MSDQKLMVLKFGGSVLREKRDVFRVVQEIHLWRRRGYRVVAVVSAVGDTTNQLAETAAGFGEHVDEHKTARLLATGELESAALLGLALDESGIAAWVGDPANSGLRTSGPILDATLREISVAGILGLLEHYGVVILPGFIGEDDQGNTTLLGRGGSDLTALFVADRLNADRCRLIKDVDGIYESDPRRNATQAKRFSRLNYRDALQLDESIVQHKAIRFAQESDLTFEVSALSTAYHTSIGGYEASRLTDSLFTATPEPEQRLRVSLLGLGTVGFGVYQRLTSLYENHFEIIAVAVNDWKKAVRNGIPPELICDSPEQAIDADCDVVVELVGGVEKPLAWIERALAQGKHVVTANKAVTARYSTRLRQKATRQGVHIAWSAAVGGSLPILELIQTGTANRSSTGNRKVVRVQGVINGSSNCVLDLIEGGFDFHHAVSRAVSLGLTERDPKLDLDGIDAAEKLVLIAAACGHRVDLEQITRESLEPDRADQFDWSRGQSLRQIATLTIDDNGAQAAVATTATTDAELRAIRGAENFVRLHFDDGKTTSVRGLGAGRWPTTVSVLSDLIDLALTGDTPAAVSESRCRLAGVHA